MKLNEGLEFANRYVFIKLLGRGGFSEVWLAKDNLTNVKVAVKVYAPESGLDDAGIKLFTQEFTLVFDMNHTNLLTPTYFDCWERMPYLILPYCKNGSAFKYITSDDIISEEECWQLLHDVAAGLAYLHEKTPPLIHQDIKPDNILVNDEGKFMITDFGISARVRNTISSTANEQSSGTLSYMGPERFSANPKPIMASDIWSLGAMMFELMAHGNPPFGNHGGLLQKNGADIPLIEEPYSEELKQIVYRCLAKETWERPTARFIEELTYKKIHGLMSQTVERPKGTKTEETKEIETKELNNKEQSDNQLNIKEEDTTGSEEEEQQLTAEPLPIESESEAASVVHISGNNNSQNEKQEALHTIKSENTSKPQKQKSRNTAQNVVTNSQHTSYSKSAIHQSEHQQEVESVVSSNKKSKLPIILLLAFVAILVVCGGIYLLTGNDDTQTTESTNVVQDTEPKQAKENPIVQKTINMAWEKKLRADSIYGVHLDDLFNETHESIEDIYMDALQNLRQLEGEMSTGQSENIQNMTKTLTDSLRSLHYNLTRQADAMKAIELSVAKEYEDRAKKIEQIITP